MSDFKNKGDSSYESLRQLSGLDEHIEFVENLVKKYDWDKATMKDFNTKLKNIKDKQKDELLNISIIGEFSTGKSTFINALLRTDLLTSDVIQGTTVSNTIIAYDKNYRLVVHYKNSEVKKLDFQSLESLKQSINEYTANPDEAQKITTVEIYLPAEPLKNRYRIIDTPGTNATTAWHEEVTRNALRELSDISLILTAADKLLPDSFCDFVEENISDVLPQCAFVVTKIDTVRPKERKRIADYINMKIKNRFEIQNPVVFSYSSLDILDGVEGKDKIINPDGKNADLIRESLENEQKIFEYTGKTRMIVQIKKLLSMTDNMYDFIMPKIEKIKSSYESKLKLLQESKQANLDDFIMNQKYERVEEFRNSARELREAFKGIITDAIPSYQEAVYNDIKGINSSEGILSYIRDGMPDYVREDSMELIQKTSDFMYDDIFEEYSNELLYFCDCFEEYFRDMKLLEIEFEVGNYVKPKAPNINTSNFNAAANAVAEQIKKEDLAMFGGAAGGAAIGTALFPGIGTLIGGAIGYFAGSSAVDIDKTRKAAIGKLQNPLYNYYNSVKSQILSSLDSYTTTLCNQMEYEIQNYLNVYKKEVDRRIAEEEKAEKQIQGEISVMLADINGIDNRKEKMNNFRKLLNQQ